jgi:hypothetical protein
VGQGIREGALKPGEVGTIVADDNDHQPYDVRAPSGETYWYKVSDVVAADADADADADVDADASTGVAGGAGAADATAGSHSWRTDKCRICIGCQACTGYGTGCVHHADGRTPGEDCGCGSGDGGCRDCGICRKCAVDNEIPCMSD